MAKRKQAELIRGTATHPRTEGDYMSVLLDTVTLDDWRGVVSGHVMRGWLLIYFASLSGVMGFLLSSRARRRVPVTKLSRINNA